MQEKEQSPSRMVKQLDTRVSGVVRNIDVRKLSLKERNILADLAQNLTNAKVYSTDYELSETREEQLKNAKTAKKWLDQAHKNILAASEFNVFGPVDVAHLSAQIDQTASWLK